MSSAANLLCNQADKLCALSVLLERGINAQLAFLVQCGSDICPPFASQQLYVKAASIASLLTVVSIAKIRGRE